MAGKLHNDLTGRKFGRLTVIERSANGKGGIVMWRCKCDCGNEITTRSTSLVGGKTVSCGCKKREFLIKLNTKHGLSNHPLYHVIADMVERCYNPNSGEYFRYGARGITICEEWRKNKDKFIQWALENGYKKGLQIDRINNDGNYSPDNCRFATPRENTNNRRITVKTTLFGKVMCVSEIAEKYNLSQDLVRKRIHKGLKDHDVIQGGYLANG